MRGDERCRRPVGKQIQQAVLSADRCLESGEHLIIALVGGDVVEKLARRLVRVEAGLPLGGPRSTCTSENLMACEKLKRTQSTSALKLGQDVIDVLRKSCDHVGPFISGIE